MKFPAGNRSARQRPPHQNQCCEALSGQAQLSASALSARTCASSRERCANRAGTGRPKCNATRARKRRGRLDNAGPPQWDVHDPHRPAKPTGITGTGSRNNIASSPRRKACTSPFGVNRPSGKSMTTSPSRNARLTSSSARRTLPGSRRSDSTGIAPTNRNSQLSQGDS